MVQVAITIGLCIGFFMCYGTVKVETSFSWRFPFAFQAGTALVLAMLSEVYLPQTPRWLLYRNRPEEAARAWEALGIAEADRQEDIPLEKIPESSQTALAVDEPHPPALRRRRQQLEKGTQNLKKLFTKDAKKPMLLGVFLMSMQQLSGIDGVLYVSLLH